MALRLDEPPHLRRGRSRRLHDGRRARHGHAQGAARGLALRKERRPRSLPAGLRGALDGRERDRGHARSFLDPDLREGAGHPRRRGRRRPLRAGCHVERRPARGGDRHPGGRRALLRAAPGRRLWPGEDRARHPPRVRHGARHRVERDVRGRGRHPERQREIRPSGAWSGVARAGHAALGSW